MSRIVGWVLLMLNLAAIIFHMTSPIGTPWASLINFIGAMSLLITLPYWAD